MADHTMNINDVTATYDLVVRMLPQGEEVDMQLPAASTGKIIKESLLDHPELDIPKTDHAGNRYTYQLVSKSSGMEITDDKTLFECGVNNGDTLILNPRLVAG